MKRIFALLLALAMVICLAGMAAAEGGPGGAQYRLIEEDDIAEIEAEAVPLAAPAEGCCVLHFVLMLCALAVTVYFTHDRKVRQRRIHELRLAGAI